MELGLLDLLDFLETPLPECCREWKIVLSWSSLDGASTNVKALRYLISRWPRLHITLNIRFASSHVGLLQRWCTRSAEENLLYDASRALRLAFSDFFSKGTRGEFWLKLDLHPLYFQTVSEHCIDGYGGSAPRSFWRYRLAWYLLMHMNA